METGSPTLTVSFVASKRREGLLIYQQSYNTASLDRQWVEDRSISSVSFGCAQRAIPHSDVHVCTHLQTLWSNIHKHLDEQHGAHTLQDKCSILRPASQEALFSILATMTILGRIIFDDNVGDSE